VRDADRRALARRDADQALSVRYLRAHARGRVAAARHREQPVVRGIGQQHHRVRDRHVGGEHREHVVEQRA
jgi:hypothetical protein